MNLPAKILILLGMHRSGTSLTANWLHHCGLFLGDRLLGVKESNKKGHFEDVEILNLHEKILKENDLTYKVDSLRKLNIPDFFYEEAEEIINQRSNNSTWGWKEPRTCLFIKEWNKLVPNSKKLILYRNPFAVAESLIDREIGYYKKTGNNLRFLSLKLRRNHFVRRYLEIWNKYNSEILKFVLEESSANYIVLNNNDIVKYDKKIFNHLLIEWNIELEYKPIKDIFSKNLITRREDKYSQYKLPNHIQETLNKMMSLRQLTLEKIDATS